MSRLLDVQPRHFVKQLICDKCGLKASVDEHEFHNFVSLDFDCTWGSSLGDGHHVDLDLCHACVKETLGPWLRVTSSGWTKPAMGEWSDLNATLLRPDEALAAKDLAIETQMLTQAAEWVMTGARWLSAMELCSELPKTKDEIDAVLPQWLETGQIFALERNGIKLYPLYAFDSLGEPVPILKQVLEVLQGYSSFQIASWFESPSSYLRGKRPREVLEVDAASVMIAAKRRVEGAVHG
jgi:hypothetical protein